MQPGANNEVWWTGTYGVEQIKEFMLLIKNIHPGKIAIVAFDNSTNQYVYPPNAPKLGAGCNKKRGGVNAPGNSVVNHVGVPLPRMKDGWFMRDIQNMRQIMHEEDGTFKGTSDIIKERGVSTSSV